eukprot:scaffold19482_cov153-Skeletonema_menzelii.AAC.7
MNSLSRSREREGAGARSEISRRDPSAICEIHKMAMVLRQLLPYEPRELHRKDNTYNTKK